MGELPRDDLIRMVPRNGVFAHYLKTQHPCDPSCVTGLPGRVRCPIAFMRMRSASKTGLHLASNVRNVTPSGTYKPLSLVDAYRAAKAAVNAFTESPASEVEPFDVRLGLVLPGSSGQTRFRETARVNLRGFEVYGEFMRSAIAR